MTNDLEVTAYYGTLRDMPIGTRLYYANGNVRYLCEMQGVNARGFVVVKAVLDVTRSQNRAPRQQENIKTRAKNLFLWAYQRPKLFTLSEPWPSCQWFTDLDTPALKRELNAPWPLK